MPVHTTSRRVSQGGFTLIEALIAFVILSIGLLGIVSLQSMSKTSQHLAIQHTRAVTLADAIVERIRVNPAGMSRYNIGLNPLGGGTIAAEPAPTCSGGATCDPNELALHDLWAWEQALDGEGATLAGAPTAGLIAPQGCIVFAAPDATRPGTGTLNVIIQWRGLHESFDAVQAGDVNPVICGGGAVAGADNFRRQVIVNTYVVDEEDF